MDRDGIRQEGHAHRCDHQRQQGERPANSHQPCSQFFSPFHTPPPLCPLSYASPPKSQGRFPSLLEGGSKPLSPGKRGKKAAAPAKGKPAAFLKRSPSFTCPRSPSPGPGGGPDTGGLGLPTAACRPGRPPLWERARTRQSRCQSCRRQRPPLPASPV